MYISILTPNPEYCKNFSTQVGNNEVWLILSVIFRFFLLYSPSDIVKFQRNDSPTESYRMVWCKTHYDVTDKNNNVSFEGLNRHSDSFTILWCLSQPSKLPIFCIYLIVFYRSIVHTGKWCPYCKVLWTDSFMAVLCQENWNLVFYCVEKDREGFQ